MKRCPACRSMHVSRSTFGPGEHESHRFQSPYQCDDCGAHFWVLSRVVRMRAVTTAVILAMTVVVSTGFAALVSSIGGGAHDTTTAGSAASANALQMVPVGPLNSTSSSRP